MLRNVFQVRHLRQLSLLKQGIVRPIGGEETDAAIWQRHVALHTTSGQTTSQPGETSSECHERNTIKKHPRKWPPKGKPLHRRVLSEHQKAEQQEMRREMRNQLAEDIFGQFPQKGSFTDKPNKARWKSSQRKEENVTEQGQHPGTTSRVLTEKQLRLADSGAVVEKVVSEKGSEQWSDMFGTMVDPSELQPLDKHANHSSDNQTTEDYEDDDDDDHVPLREYGRHSRKTVFWYGRQLERLGKKGQVYEAIQLLEETMIKEDRVQPNSYVFTVVIGICGRVGYTKKAFMLFNKMKKSGLTPEDPTYTALFNACANSPWPEDGLRRANQLLHQMAEKGIEPNSTTLKAVVKVYGQLGELQTAFRIMDRMMVAGQHTDPEAWKHLLIACISDKEAGFNHAIKVWRLMRKKKITPDLNHYNLLLRAARDCGVGEEQFANKLVGKASTQLLPDGATSDTHSVTPEGTRKLEVPQLMPHGVDSSDAGVAHKSWFQYSGVPAGKSILPTADDVESELAATHEEDTCNERGNTPLQEYTISVLNTNVPNILNPRGMWRHGNVKLGALDTPEPRLGLLGGLPGVLSHMARDGVKPDIKTFSQLLDMCPKEESAEDDLVTTMMTVGIKPDADLLNQIIRRRCRRNNLEAATDVLELFSRTKLVPNLLTYGSLALGCRDYSTGNQLLSDMENAGMEPTLDIFGILLRRSRMDFRYKKSLCQRMRRLNIAPNAAVVEGLESSVAFARKILLQKERGEPVPQHFQRSKFPEEFKDFMLYYKGWLLKSPLEAPHHPWTQYRHATGGEKVQAVMDQDYEPV